MLSIFKYKALIKYQRGLSFQIEELFLVRKLKNGNLKVIATKLRGSD